MLLEYRSDSCARLTPRQVEVAWHFVLGSRAADVAARIGIATNTIRNHIRDSYARLGVHTKAALASYLVRHHLGEFLRAVAAGDFVDTLPQHGDAGPDSC